MNPEADWQSIRGDRGSVLGIAGVGILRITLLFGSAAVALALILAPIADSQTRQFVEGGGHAAVVTSLERIGDAVAGRAGTLVTA